MPAFLAPYAVKAGGVLLLVALLASGIVYVRLVRAENAALEIKATQAEANLRLVEKNAGLAMRIMQSRSDLIRQREGRIGSLLQEVRRANSGVPRGCERVLDPVRAAVAGVRDLRALHQGNGAAPSAGVPGRP